MEFFSGFGFKNEKALFKSILEMSQFCIAGFSYGAQKAMEASLQKVASGERVQKVQLISPAFFNFLPKEKKLKEINNFVKNRDLYMNFFYKKACYPYKEDISIFKREPELRELKDLLFYEWRSDKLEMLRQNGVSIEVYVGSMDKIVNPKEVVDFFQPFATVYEIKNVGHILREEA